MVTSKKNLMTIEKNCVMSKKKLMTIEKNCVMRV